MKTVAKCLYRVEGKDIATIDVTRSLNPSAPKAPAVWTVWGYYRAPDGPGNPNRYTAKAIPLLVLQPRDGAEQAQQPPPEAAVDRQPFTHQHDEEKTDKEKKINEENLEIVLNMVGELLFIYVNEGGAGHCYPCGVALALLRELRLRYSSNDRLHSYKDALSDIFRDKGDGYTERAAEMINTGVTLLGPDGKNIIRGVYKECEEKKFLDVFNTPEVKRLLYFVTMALVTLQVVSSSEKTALAPSVHSAKEKDEKREFDEVACILLTTIHYVINLEAFASGRALRALLENAKNVGLEIKNQGISNAHLIRDGARLFQLTDKYGKHRSGTTVRPHEDNETQAKYIAFLRQVFFNKEKEALAKESGKVRAASTQEGSKTKHFPGSTHKKWRGLLDEMNLHGDVRSQAFLYISSKNMLPGQCGGVLKRAEIKKLLEEKYGKKKNAEADKKGEGEE